MFKLQIFAEQGSRLMIVEFVQNIIEFTISSCISFGELTRGNVSSFFCHSHIHSALYNANIAKITMTMTGKIR